MSRWISWVRPESFPLLASRGVRSDVARGSIEYSAVTHPFPFPINHGGTRGSYEAAHRTRVFPISSSTDPSAHSR
jgi:hypothetical protein